MTYFRTGSPYYHRRAAVSRSCSGWEGVVPTGCGRQALKVGRSKAWVRSFSRKHQRAMRMVMGSSRTGY
jgi:hypothetical protein